MRNSSSPRKALRTTRDLKRVRSQFLEGASVPAEQVREPILSSWQRSQFWGVDADRLDTPYDPDFDPRSKLAMASGPVLDRLADVLSGTPVSLILTDSKGRIRERRTGDRSLDQHLDKISLAPGFSYAEEFVGTNGIGTAVESGKPVQVFGAEHFSERLQRVSCAGAPIRNPASGRVIGLIDITCWRTEASPLMVALARQAAADIEERLLQLGSEREQALLREFISSGRSSGRALVTLSDGLLIADNSAAELLTPDDHRMLRERLQTLAPDQDHQLTLSDGRTIKARSRAVTALGGSAPSGHIVEIRLVNEGSYKAAGTACPPVRLPHLAGRSPAWRTTVNRVVHAHREHLWMLVTGEAGSGKASLVQAVHQQLSPAEPFNVHDVTAMKGGGGSWLQRLRQDLRQDRGTVVIRHLDALPSSAEPALTQLLNAAQERGGWVVGLYTAPAGAGGHPQPRNRDSVNRNWNWNRNAVKPVPIARFLDYQVSIAPLRHRSDDVAALVPALLARIAKGIDTECSDSALRLLTKAPWPGNVRQLEGTLRYAMARRTGPLLETTDLPASLLSRTEHPLTAWETTERDLIVQALLDHGGDKAEAARSLGISRATIYRKITAFDIRLG
ncbi:sigma-54-dependent Fis family transcriptional regulator [Streptomyces sp. NPDC000880]